MPSEPQTIKGPYKPRRIRRNPIPHITRYFKTALWKDLKEKIEKAEHICFIIVQNGEVNNVYIKTIEDTGTMGQENRQNRGGPSKAHGTVQAPASMQNQPENRKNNIKTEETLHQNLQETDAPKAIEAEIPEETTELPPEAPKIVPEPPTAAIKPSAPPITPPPPASPETPPTPHPEDSGTDVKAGHRVKAIYENQEVKGVVERVLKESGRPDEFVTILDSGRKVILGERKIVDGIEKGDGLVCLLVREE